MLWVEWDELRARLPRAGPLNGIKICELQAYCRSEVVIFLKKVNLK